VLTYFPTKIVLLVSNVILFDIVCIKKVIQKRMEPSRNVNSLQRDLCVNVPSKSW
jgi:hypothetical protein